MGQKTPEDLDKEQKQPLLAAKTTSQKTQRKKWFLFSSKSSGKQEFEEKENNDSIAQTATGTNVQGLQTPEHVALSRAKDRHSPVTISNGVSVAAEGEESLLLTTGQDNKDTSRNANSRNSQENLGISERSSTQDVYQKSKNPECSLELTSVEQRKTKQTNELSKKEEANLGHHDSMEASAECSELLTKDAENVITLRSKS